jgi:hypothetical protein
VAAGSLAATRWPDTIKDRVAVLAADPVWVSMRTWETPRMVMAWTASCTTESAMARETTTRTADDVSVSQRVRGKIPETLRKVRIISTPAPTRLSL